MPNKIILQEWRDRHKRAKKAKGFSEDDRRDAHKWRTCAVGEGRKLVRFSDDVSSYSPEDEFERTLGMQFSRAVAGNNLEKVEKIINKLERFYNAENADT